MRRDCINGISGERAAVLLTEKKALPDDASSGGAESAGWKGGRLPPQHAKIDSGDEDQNSCAEVCVNGESGKREAHRKSSAGAGVNGESGTAESGERQGFKLKKQRRRLNQECGDGATGRHQRLRRQPT
jgi:hypothetical protein